MQFNNSTCLFCLGPHDTAECPAYPTIGIRTKLLNAQKTCYRCLIPGHIPPKCKNVVPCDGCGRLSHHKALCWKNDAIKDVVFNSELERCVFCHRHYDSNGCRLFDTHSERKMIMEATSCCVKCLKIHIDQSCDSQNVPCAYCKKVDHHKALCSKNFRLKENKDVDPAFSNCLLCARHNNSTQCSQVKLLSQRQQILFNQGRCFQCLRLHPTAECHNRYRCRICRSSDHHELLCPNDPRVVVDEEPSMIEIPIYQSSSSTSGSSRNSTSDSSENYNTNDRTAESSRSPLSFFDFVMNLQLPPAYAEWTF